MRESGRSREGAISRGNLWTAAIRLAAFSLLLSIPCAANDVLRSLLGGKALARPITQDQKGERKGLLITELTTVLPQIASGGDEVSGGLFTLLSFTNLTDGPATFELFFYDQSGAPVNMPIATADAGGNPCFTCPPALFPGVGDTLLPGQSLGQIIMPNGETRVGYASISSAPSAAVGITATFAQIVPGRPLFMTGIPPSYDLHLRAFMASVDAGGFTSSMALVAAQVDTNVTLTFRSNFLNVQCSNTFFMPVGSHQAFLLRDKLSCIDGQEGSVEVSGRGFAGIGIWAHDEGAFVTQPLMERLAPAAAPPIPATLPGYTLTCQTIGGMLIFAQDGKFLGEINSNRFAQNSIANQYGPYGSSYSSTSIFNSFGTYGGQFSAQSPFNPFASSPPVLVSNGTALAFVTTNGAKTPRVDPNAIKACLGL